MVMAGYSPSVRLFEAAACGARIVSDNWPGLENFFRRRRDSAAHWPEDVVRYLRDLSEDEIRSIGSEAQARVLEEHTSAARALQFERAVESAASDRTSDVKPLQHPTQVASSSGGF